VFKEFPLPRVDARPYSVAVDTAGNVWYTDISGWLGVLPADRARIE
jgi:virginiamycin B lyase